VGLRNEAESTSNVTSWERKPKVGAGSSNRATKIESKRITHFVRDPVVEK